MPNNHVIFERIRKIMKRDHVIWTEKKMIGGDCFTVDDKLCCGIFKGGIVARIDPNEIEALLEKRGVEPMQFGGKIMKGYLYIKPEGFHTEDELNYWIQKCLDFNPLVKTKKKGKKQ